MSYTASPSRPFLIETLQWLGKAFKSIGVFMMENCEGNRRLKQVEALRALSDEELARLNIKRDQIVERVFRSVS